MDEKRQDLLYAFERLANQSELTRKLLRAVPESRVWTPPEFDRNQAVTEMAFILTRLFKYPDKHQRDKYPTGFVAVDTDCLNALSELNTRKLQFKAAIASYKGLNEKGTVWYNKHNEVRDLLTQAAKNRGRRSKELEQALSDTRLSELDLKCCYRQVRLLDNNIKSVSWLRESRHIRTHRVSRAELISMVEQLDESLQLGPMLEIGKVADDYFAIAKKTSERYMANLTWHDRTKGQPNLVPVSSFLVSDCDDLPVFKWLEQGERQGRSGRYVDLSVAFIHVLSAYRYTERQFNKEVLEDG